MPSLKNDLIRGKETNKQGYAEFFRRVNIWHELGGLKPDEIKFILVHHGITDPATQKEFRHFTKFGDLVNEIMLNKQLNS